MSRAAPRWLLSIALYLAAVTSSADDGGHGRELFAPCTACHGQRAEGNHAVQAPALAGLPEWYVAQQLRSFRGGRRGADAADLYGAQMARMAEQLWDDGEVVSVTAYVASLPSTESRATVRGKANRGKATFVACATCHGTEAQGSAQLGAPPLRGLDDWYVVNALNAFRTGLRGSDPQDTHGLQMRAAAAALADEQAVLDVVAYLATL
jgi:cytochrome c oxidase subunit II